MSGSNKILTVSYGTFSCTLEGFDEPFDTMRGIAEYFRDLAADDRYFGAEPPTPDADMLQAIAQRQVQQRVEARKSEAGIALTQTKATVSLEPKAADAPPPAAPEDSGPLTFEDDYLMSDEPEDILTVDKSVPPAGSTERVETVAEKLRRIRAVVSRSIEPGEAPNSFSTAPDAVGEAGAKPLRDRAYTRTINEITADLAAEDAFEDVDEHADHPTELDDDVVDENDQNDLSRLDGGKVAGLESGETEAESKAAKDSDIENLMAHDEDAPEAETENAFTEADEEDGNVEDSERDLIASVLKAGQQTDPAPEKPAELEATSREVEAPTEDHKRIDGSDESVDRLLKETDNQFADDAGIRRRRVISQMRAAVAATKAERVLLGSQIRDDAEHSTPYKDDLKQAISRAVSATPPEKQEDEKVEPKTVSDAAPKAPPLVLVSSQRVDAPANPSSDDKPAEGSFREFAKEMGANELPDLMEAAAAYTSFVEGQPHFSRPEIMKRVARVDPALEISREAGLRSFGQLLRQGKIRKLDRGQFVIDEETRFHPGQRIAGQ